MRRAGVHGCGVVALALALAACHRPPVEVPGATDVAIADVSIVAAAGTELTVDYSTLLDTLGIRKGSLIRPERPFNPFRLNEDRRRVMTHAHLHGRFEAEVAEPTLEGKDPISVTFAVREGPQYTIADVKIVGAPDGTEAALNNAVPFGPGDPINMLIYRPLRRTLAELLQAEGYGHARVYSRTFVDRDAKTASWYYFVDAGPKTVVRSIEVAGNRRVDADTILDRIDLAVGGPYSTAAKKRAELTLLDSGSFRSVVLRHNADVLAGPPQHPDTGGAPAAIDASGNLVARELEPGIDVRVVVVEAPARQVRIEAGSEADPARFDVFGGARLLLRDVAGVKNHLVLEGRIGRGWRFGDDDAGNPDGLYGDALVRAVRAGFLAPRLDLRLSARLRQTLFPDATVREYSVGPGLRAVPSDRLYLEFDALYVHARELGFPAFAPGAAMDLALADDSLSRGALVTASLIRDHRDDRIEATRGHMLALRGEVSPGGPLSSHRSLRLEADARGFLPLTDKWSLAARGAYGWVGLETDDGIPLGSRLFGGGAYGFRGLGRQELASAVACDAAEMCDEVLVGSRSLAEASLEARLLPFRALYGAAVFLDAGGAGEAGNPLADGVSLAVGFGARLRSWYVPVSIDVAYRFIDENEWQGPTALGRFALFARVGEAF